MTRAGIAMLMLTLSSCSSALSLSGELDGEPVPAGFSGAMAQVDFGGQDAWFGVWSTFGDTCGLSGALMNDINEHLDDADDTDDSIEDFFADVPGDFWLLTTAFFSRDGGDLDDEEDFADINAAGFLCHFTDGPDLSDNPKRACAALDASSNDATVRVVDDNSLSFSGEFDLVQQGAGGTDDAGTVTGSAVAATCPVFANAMEDFLGGCAQSNGGRGCQAAFDAYIRSHTISR